jgi:hypothetical protein
MRAGRGLGELSGHEVVSEIHMTPLIVALVVVAVIVAGGLVGLFLSRRLPIPAPDVLERVARRERELEARERRDSDDGAL